METTTNYKLPQWVKSDQIKMDDFNDAFGKIDAQMKKNADAANAAASAESGMLPAMARMPAAATRVRRFIRNVLFGYEPPRGGAWRHYARGCRGPSGRLKVC